MNRAHCDVCDTTLLRADSRKPCGGCGGTMSVVSGDPHLVGVPPNPFGIPVRTGAFARDQAMKTVKMRCTGCGSAHEFKNQGLDVCRAKVCERCGIKLTVTSSEGQIDPPPKPEREWRVLTVEEIKEARRILVEAFGTEKE